jgi:Domain of unknown function (DUF4258)
MDCPSICGSPHLLNGHRSRDGAELEQLIDHRLDTCDAKNFYHVPRVEEILWSARAGGASLILAPASYQPFPSILGVETEFKIRHKGNYLVKMHAVRHALKEGFDRIHMVEAILEGTIIEEYPDDQRVLICGKTNLSKTTVLYLHVVCEHTDAVFVEFVTAYMPDEGEWESPPLRRRIRERR